ncbi:PIN domain-containing protein [Candidatus Undinarchaeota archaeon]
MLKVILDTNFLMIPLQFGVDIYSELNRLITEKYSLCTIQPVFDELEKLSKTKPEASAAFRLAKLKKIQVIECHVQLEGTDPKILAAAESENAVVCTNDAALRRKAKDKGLRVIALRQKAYLMEV